MKDPQNMDRFERFIVRRQVVAVMHQPQSDEPPGRAPYRQREIVLAENTAKIPEVDVQSAIAEVMDP